MYIHTSNSDLICLSARVALKSLGTMLVSLLDLKLVTFSISTLPFSQRPSFFVLCC